MDYLIQGKTLSAIGDAIRAKTGKSEMIVPENMPSEISAISGGGGEADLSEFGKTKLLISIPPNAMPGKPPVRNIVDLYIQQSVSNGVVINWGDNSEEETINGTGAVTTSHTYNSPGDFVISVFPQDGCVLGLGDGTSSHTVVGESTNNRITYLALLKKAFISGLDTISNYSFFKCTGLNEVKILSDVKKSVTTLFLVAPL